MGGVIALVVVAVALAGFIVGRGTAPPATVDPTMTKSMSGLPPGNLPRVEGMEEKSSDPAYPNPKEMDPLIDAVTSIPLGEFFSTRSNPLSTTRMFRFPGKGESLGTIMTLSPTMKVSRLLNGRLMPTQKVPNACGWLLMENFKPFGLQVSDHLLSQPHLFKSFRDDELADVCLINTLATDNAMKDIGGLTSIKVLNVRGSRALTDACFEDINKLPELSDLTISETSLSPSALIRLKRLRDLKVIRMKNMNKVGPVLQALKGSTKLEQMDLRFCGLHADELASLASMPNLRVLDLSGDNDLKGIGRVLLKLHKLESVYTDGTNLPASELPQFKKMSWLKRLTLEPSKDWTRQQLEELKRALPNCKITPDQKDTDEH